MNVKDKVLYANKSRAASRPIADIRHTALGLPVSALTTHLPPPPPWSSQVQSKELCVQGHSTTSFIHLFSATENISGRELVTQPRSTRPLHHDHCLAGARDSFLRLLERWITQPSGYLTTSSTTSENRGPWSTCLRNRGGHVVHC